MLINIRPTKAVFIKILTGLLITITFSSKAALNIFVCEPEYAALATELSPDSDIFSATTALQDPHFVQARPSLIAKMRNADLVICAGADLEAGWLDMLQKKSNNAKVQSTELGLFLASNYVENLDVPEVVDKSQGDVHALGNPHVHLDPIRVAILASALNIKLQQLDAKNAAVYQKNYEVFAEKWQQAITQWQQQIAPLKGKKVISYHSSFRYLFAFTGILVAADLEPKAGMPPTTSHLTSLINLIKQEHITLVVYAPYQQEKPAFWLKEKTGINTLLLPYTIGGHKQSKDLFSLMDNHIELLLAAFND